MSDPFFEKTEARRKELDKLVVPAIKATEADISVAVGGKKAWGDHFGAIGISPRHLCVYFVLPKRRDVAELKQSQVWLNIRTALHDRLRLAGYPVDVLGAQWLELYSEQECQEQANGNWYHFFK